MTPARSALESLLLLCPCHGFVYAVESFFFNEFSIHGLNRKEKNTLGEVDLLRRLLPKDVLKQLGELGPLGSFLTSTLLRHRATQIHAMWLKSRFEFKDLILPNNFRHLADRWGMEFNNRSQNWGFGFSPIGFYQIIQPHQMCAAFDLYDCQFCREEVFENIFCPKHVSSHSWWEPQFKAHWSVQATMFAFYASPEAIDAYSQEDLEKLLNKFFFNLKQLPKTTDCDDALHFFGLKNIEEYKSRGPLWLKKKYREMAMLHHPDSGGSHEEFCKLDESYTCLMRMFL